MRWSRATSAVGLTARLIWAGPFWTRLLWARLLGTKLFFCTKLLCTSLLGTSLLFGSLAAATEPQSNAAIATVSKPAARYQDVREDLLMAIEAQGYVVGAIGDLGSMLSRSAADFSIKPVYLSAEYFNFCPTTIAHELMTADPTNLAYCPFQMFLYETVATPGTIVVGYRHPGIDGNAATRAILAKAERVFADIIRLAVK
jgi:uncharacterized protein (DUF302 family)